MLTLPETPGHPYSGVLAGPHLSRPCRFLVPPPFESLSLTLAGSGRVFVTGAGVRNHLILRRRSCVAKLDAGCFPHNSQPRQERKKNQKRKNAATTPPKTYSQLHRSYYKGQGEGAIWFRSASIFSQLPSLRWGAVAKERKFPDHLVSGP